MILLFFGKTRAEREKRVKVLLRRLKEWGLSINLNKFTVFKVEEVEFLWHRLSKNKVQPNQSNGIGK